jgi:hypothetical protein
MWKRAVVCGVAVLLLAEVSPAATAAAAGGVSETVWHSSYRQVAALERQHLEHPPAARGHQ